MENIGKYHANNENPKDLSSKAEKQQQIQKSSIALPDIKEDDDMLQPNKSFPQKSCPTKKGHRRQRSASMNSYLPSWKNQSNDFCGKELGPKAAEIDNRRITLPETEKNFEDLLQKKSRNRQRRKTMAMDNLWERRRLSTIQADLGNRRRSRQGSSNIESLWRMSQHDFDHIIGKDIDEEEVYGKNERKRSSTTSNPVPNITFTDTTVVKNMSIFKRSNQDGSSDDVLVNIKNDGGFEDEWMEDKYNSSVENSEETLNHSNSVSRSRMAFDPHFRNKSAAPFKTRRYDVSTSELRSRKRTISLATFITSSQTNDLYKQRTSLSLENLRVPRRWLSLRNVVSCINVLILAISIMIIAVVSYFAGIRSTKEAITAMSNVTVSSVMNKLNGVLDGAEKANIFTQSIYDTPEYPLSDTQKGINHIYFLMTRDSNEFDMIYVVSPLNLFMGVELYRNSVGVIEKDKMLVKHQNVTTRPYRLVNSVSSLCSYRDTSCVMQAFNPANPTLNNSTYVVSSRPFFKHAEEKARAGWSEIYLYSDGKTLGITAVRPVYLSSTLEFVSAVDISLKMLSDYLIVASKSIAGDGGIRPLFFIIEADSGLLVATSNPEVPLVSNSTKRIKASDSSFGPVRICIEKLEEIYGPLRLINWADSPNPLTFQTEDAQVVFDIYRKAEKDINWIVTTYIPFATYNQNINNTYFTQVPLVSVLVLVFSMLVSVMVTRSVGKPLKMIAQQMLDIADFSFEELYAEQDVPDVQKSHNSIQSKLREQNNVQSLCANLSNMQLKEVQYLKSAMSAMKSGLKSFAKYVPLDIVTLLLKMKREAVLGVDEMDLTVMFMDIVDFTKITETLPPQKLVELMKEFLSSMSEIIIESNGVVDKYIGDAIMAFWNAPISVRNHPDVSCTVALKCQKLLHDLRDDWKKKGLPELKTRIGINTGGALVGNIGSTNRFNYTVIGDNVNIASRLEALNKRYGTSILISQNVVEKLHLEFFVVRPLDFVRMKGKSLPIKVYELVGFRRLMAKSIVEAYEIYEAGFEEYCLGNFVTAANHFERFLRIVNVVDKAAIDKFTICNKLRQLTPRERADWTPIITMCEK